MKTTRLQKIINGLIARNFDFDTAETYGEPGYTTDKPLIILGNWNGLSKSTLDVVESEMEIEWRDEWVIDDDRRAFRSQPDCYSWRPSWFLHGGEIIPNDSLSGDVDELRDYGFIFQPGDCVELKSVPENVDLSKIAGLVQNDNRTGFHPGQDANPAAILKSLPMGDYCFQIDDKGQFDCTWSIWKIRETSES